MQIGTTQFINTGADKATLQFCSDELTKSAGKAGLVEVIRTVTRGGRSFSQTYWVKPSDVKASDTVLGKQGADMVATHKQSVGDAKKNMVTLLSTHGRDALMAHAKSVGASWKETDNPGINWMRASMAIQKHMAENPGQWDSSKIVGGTQQKPSQQAGTQATPNTAQSAQPTQQIKQQAASPQSTPKPEKQSAGKPKGDAQQSQQPTGDPKAKVKSLAETMGKDQLMATAKQAGITWKENPNPGINWMRAAMAMSSALKSNPGALDGAQGAQPSQPDPAAQAQSTATQASKDAKAAQKTAQDAQKQVKQLQDLVSQLQAKQATAQGVAAQQKQASILDTVTTDFKSGREKKEFGDALSKATPEQFMQARTLGMCAGDAAAADYLGRLYAQYTTTMGAIDDPAAARQKAKDIDPDALRNKLQGVVNKQVVGVVKSSLSKVRKRTTQFTLQQKLLEPWANPNMQFTDEQNAELKKLSGQSRSSYQQRISTEGDSSHGLMKAFLDKLEQHPEYQGLAVEYKGILEEYDQLTDNDPYLQTITGNIGNLGAQDSIAASLHYNLEKAKDNLKKREGFVAQSITYTNDNIQKVQAGETDPASQFYVDPTMTQAQQDTRRQMNQRIIDNYKSGLAREQQLLENSKKNLETAQRLQDKYSDQAEMDKLVRAAAIRHQLFDPKFTDLNANLWHAKAMAAQIAYQYRTQRDFVAEYPVLSKADIDKLEAGDQDALTNLALQAGMFKPSLTKNGGTADQAIMDKFAERQAFIDAYGKVDSSDNSQGQYTEDNEIKCRVSSAPAAVVQKITDKIAKDWDKKNHGHMKYRIKGVYEVSGLALEKDFQAIKQKSTKYAGKKVGGKDCGGDLYYHGTGAMATSLILGHSGAFKVVKAKVGRMLGDGIYLADKASKSAQYISDAGYSRSGIKGSLMVVEAVTGDTLSQRTNQGYNHDTVFAGTQHGLLNSEWCVHDPNAVIPRYLVEMEVL